MCTSLVKPVFWALRHELFLPWMWASSFLMWGRCFGPQDEFVDSVGALFWKGKMFLTLEVRSVLMLPWAQKVFALTLLGHCRKAVHLGSPLHHFSLLILLLPLLALQLPDLGLVVFEPGTV